MQGVSVGPTPGTLLLHDADNVRPNAKPIEVDVQTTAGRIIARQFMAAHPKVAQELEIAAPFALQPLPQAHIRNGMYVAGASGVGKTRWIVLYLQAYSRMFPTRKIYWVSRKDDDDTVTRLGLETAPERIVFDPEKPQNHKTWKDLEDKSIIIFDDIDTMPPAERKPIDQMAHDVMHLGRSRFIDFIMVSHIAANRDKTRVALNEMTGFTYFPGRTPAKTIAYVLERYANLPPKQAMVISKLNRSPWATLYLNVIAAKPVLITDHYVDILNS